jgi:hypothetical protein
MMIDEAESPKQASELAAPYMPFKTFTNLLVRMQREGTPRRLDSDYLKNMSGATRGQLMAGLKWFGLVDAEDRPDKRLTELAVSGEDRPSAIADLFKDFYDWAIALGRERATQGELDEAFRKHGVTGSTLRKATAFYLQGAKYAELPVSPFFRPTRTEGSGGTPRRRSAPRKPKGELAGGLANKEEQHTLVDVPSDERRRDALFNVLLKKLESAEGFDDKLLDRLERMAGTMKGPEEGK